VTIVGFTIQKLLLDFEGAAPMGVGDLRDVRLKPRKSQQRLVELEQRTNVMFLIRHARRFFADRISWNLTDIAKGDVLPAAIDGVVSVTIRAKFGRGDEDGLGDHRLAPRIGPTWWYGGARGEMQRQEFDPISRLFVSLAEGTLLECLTKIFAPAREEPGTEFGIVYEDNFSRRWLDDDHARRKEKIVRPETAFRDRLCRVSRVGPSSNSSHPGTIVGSGSSGSGGSAL